MKEKEIKALISLLDDSDNNVVNVVTDNLLKKGVNIVPELEKAWESSPDEIVQERLENVIQNIQFNDSKESILEWIASGAENILEGVYCICKFQFPDIRFETIDNEIEKLKKDVWIELNSNLTALEKVKIINYIMFELHKFSRNNSNFYSPQNSFINQVLESKKGNPISLAIIYMTIAQKLGLPVYGVNLPKNFILAYKDEYRHYDSANEIEDILFYINPYNKGAVLGKREIDYFLNQQQLEHKPEFYITCSNIEIVKRLINNLIMSYEKLTFENKIARLKELLRAIESK